MLLPVYDFDRLKFDNAAPGLMTAVLDDGDELRLFFDDAESSWRLRLGSHVSGSGDDKVFDELFGPVWRQAVRALNEDTAALAG